MIHLHEKQGHFYRWKIKPIRPNPIELHLVIQSKQYSKQTISIFNTD